MQTVVINHGHIKNCPTQFSKELKKSKTLVLFYCKEKSIAQIKLIEEKKQYKIDHFFDADGLIKGDDCRYSQNIDRHIIKKLVTPKAEFSFQVWADGYSSNVTKDANLHSDIILLHVGDYEMLFSAQTCLDNSARMTNY